MSDLTNAETLRTLPAVSVIRDTLQRLERELHAQLGGLPSGPVVVDASPDPRPPLTIKRRSS
jgi:hypothetical protein